MKTKANRTTIIVGALTAAVVCVLLVWQWQWVVGWLRFHALFAYAGVNENGYQEYRHRKTKIVMVSVPGRTFAMGRRRGRIDSWLKRYPASSDELKRAIQTAVITQYPVVTLDPFLIAKYEVTQRVWKSVMGSNPSEFKAKDDLPVDSVSWFDAQQFCERASLNLPSEAQWEYACRARTVGSVAGNGNVDEMAWHAGNSGGSSHRVGQKRSNHFGLYDLHGNVYEWCRDVFDESFYEKPASRKKNPECTSGSRFRVLRGGSWMREYIEINSYARTHRIPEKIYGDVGFRPIYYRWEQ